MGRHEAVDPNHLPLGRAGSHQRNGRHWLQRLIRGASTGDGDRLAAGSGAGARRLLVAGSFHSPSVGGPGAAKKSGTYDAGPVQ
ncbi:hypothetical protein [Arthrobacter rhombi]|uniref:hypothetical protein n=1 Tax=Arthrobacter rhombi TaxID=71253 RepID=UPI003FD58E57